MNREVTAKSLQPGLPAIFTLVEGGAFSRTYRKSLRPSPSGRMNCSNVTGVEMVTT